jgi:hypothetical protein
MGREKQLESCKKCTNRKMDIQQGLICNLTSEKATFTDECTDFNVDKKIIAKEQEKRDLIRPNTKRAEIAQLLVWTVMVLDIVSIFSSYLQYNLLISLQNNETISEQVINANDSREQVIAIGYLIIFIISSVTFILWFRRAYYNLNARIKCNQTEGWAAGSWFVPIISLYRPYQIMKEMWVESTRIINTKSNSNTKSSTLIIGIWWTLWIVSNYIGSYILKTTFKAETIEDYINSTLADMTLSTLGIPLAIITVKMIKSYSFKEQKLEKLEA